MLESHGNNFNRMKKVILKNVAIRSFHQDRKKQKKKKKKETSSLSTVCNPVMNRSRINYSFNTIVLQLDREKMDYQSC